MLVPSCLRCWKRVREAPCACCATLQLNKSSKLGARSAQLAMETKDGQEGGDCAAESCAPASPSSCMACVDTDTVPVHLDLIGDLASSPCGTRIYVKRCDERGVPTIGANLLGLLRWGETWEDSARYITSVINGAQVLVDREVYDWKDGEEERHAGGRAMPEDDDETSMSRTATKKRKHRGRRRGRRGSPARAPEVGRAREGRGRKRGSGGGGGGGGSEKREADAGSDATASSDDAEAVAMSDGLLQRAHLGVEALIVTYIRCGKDEAVTRFRHLSTRLKNMATTMELAKNAVRGAGALRGPDTGAGMTTVERVRSWGHTASPPTAKVQVKPCHA